MATRGGVATTGWAWRSSVSPQWSPSCGCSLLDRGDSFFYDEWDFINLAARTGYWHNVLKPHNGHPSMIPYSIYEALLHTVGLRHYGPYQWVLLLLNVGSGGLLFLLLRKKIHPVVAGALPAALMLLGPSWQDILWAFQIGFVGSVAGGLGALVLLDRRSRRADIGACLCLLASIACSGVGLAFLAGVGVELTWRRQTWRRLWIPAIPSVLFLVWYETVGKSSYSTFSLSSLGSLGRSAADSTAATVGALLGLGSTPGGVVTGILGVLAVVALVRSPGRSGRLAMALSGLLMFWVLTLATRGASQATPIRYFYPAAALVLVAVGELPSLIAREKRSASRNGAVVGAPPVAILAMAGVLGYVGVAIWWNSDALRSGSSALSASDSQVRAEEGALDLAGSTLPRTYQPDPVEMPQVTVGPYARAASEFGSPGDSRRVIMASSESLRSSIDAWLLKGRPMVFSGPSAGRGFGACTRLPLGEARRPRRSHCRFRARKSRHLVTRHWPSGSSPSQAHIPPARSPHCSQGQRPSCAGRPAPATSGGRCSSRPSPSSRPPARSQPSAPERRHSTGTGGFRNDNSQSRDAEVGVRRHDPCDRVERSGTREGREDRAAALGESQRSAGLD